MRVPHTARIGALVVATTAFYGYVGQMVPQKEVQPPQETVLRTDLTTADMVKVGREIMDGKGLCMTCHTIGKSGALRFPDLDGVADHRPREARQVELVVRVEPDVALGHLARLHAVGADDRPGRVLGDDQVVADRVEPVLVEPGGMGLLEPLAQLQVEHLEAQPLRLLELGLDLGGVGHAGDPRAAEQPRGAGATR